MFYWILAICFSFILISVSIFFIRRSIIRKRINKLIFNSDNCEYEIVRYIPYMKFYDWIDLFRLQKLSEEFILKHKDRLDWSKITLKNKFSKRFVRDNFDLFVKGDCSKLEVAFEIETPSGYIN
jgi:hypothetical protein